LSHRGQVQRRASLLLAIRYLPPCWSRHGPCTRCGGRFENAVDVEGQADKKLRFWIHLVADNS
jgi:hypothetical protein